MSAGAVGDLRTLTSLRGIAAWLVVLYHIRLATGDQLPASLLALFAKGYLAVDFFFLLSGFVLWLSWGDRLRAEGLRAAPGFLLRRFARIWPLHAVILGAAALFALALTVKGSPDPANYPWRELPLHLALVQNWGLTERLAWNHPAWSISSEWAAYLLLPFLALSTDWRRLATPTLIAMIATLSALLATLYADAGPAGLDHDIPGRGLMRCLVEFAMGTMLCALWRRWRDAPRRPALAAAGCAAAILMVGGPEPLRVPLVFACLLLALALVDGWRLNPLRWRLLVWLGEISYSTYLVHFLLFVAFKIVFVDDPARVPLPLLGGFLLLTLFVSLFLHRLVERPAQGWINRLGDRPRFQGNGRGPQAVDRACPPSVTPTTRSPASPARS